MHLFFSTPLHMQYIYIYIYIGEICFSLFKLVPFPLATQVKALTSQDSPDPKADDMIALAEQLKVSHAHAVESMEKPIK